MQSIAQLHRPLAVKREYGVDRLRRSTDRSYPGSRRRRPARAALPPAPTSRASRSRISRKRPSMVTEIPFSINCLCRRSRALLGAGRQENLERGIRENDGAHVAALGDQPRRPAERPLARRSAPRAPPGGRRPATPPTTPPRCAAHRRRRGRRASTRAAGERDVEAGGQRRQRGSASSNGSAGSQRAQRDQPVERAAVEIVKSAARCATPAAIVPLPDAAGPSIAMTGDRRRRHRVSIAREARRNSRETSCARSRGR